MLKEVVVLVAFREQNFLRETVPLADNILGEARGRGRRRPLRRVRLLPVKQKLFLAGLERN
jgi:hypothetical protein